MAKVSTKQVVYFLIKELLINAVYISFPLVILVPIGLIAGKTYHHRVLFILAAMLFSMIISVLLIYRQYKREKKKITS